VREAVPGRSDRDERRDCARTLVLVDDRQLEARRARVDD
jgi:hypothetical protein